MVTQLTLLLVNILLINITFILAFLLRYGMAFPESNFSPYKNTFIFLSLIYIITFLFFGVFKKRFKSYWDVFQGIFAGMLLGTLFGIAFIYIFRVKWANFPSSIFAISFPIGVFLIFAFNRMFLRKTGKIKKKIVIIGAENELETTDKNSLVEKKYVEKIEHLVHQKDIDEIVISEHVYKDEQLNLLVCLLLKLKVNVVFSPVIYTKLLSENMVEENSVQFLATFVGRKSDCEEFLLKAFDVTCSTLILIFLSPLIALVCTAIKLTTKGAVFYKQDRIGKDGYVFTLYKFKTMIEDAERDTGPVLATANDPRVTKIGRILRTTRIDEIPQLFNVICGQMSLVGPRPERPYFVKQYKHLRELRLAVKPGITGLAQIRSYYDLRPQHKIKYDYLYIQRRSFMLNLYILAKTIPIVLLQKGW